METRFGASAPYTVGAEEEFQLVDPSSRELAQAIEDVIGAVPDGCRIECQSELKDLGVITVVVAEGAPIRGAFFPSPVPRDSL